MCVLIGGGGGGLCVSEDISTVWSQYFARKNRPTLWRVKTQMLDKIYFSESHGFRFFLQHAFLHMLKQSFGKVLLA